MVARRHRRARKRKARPQQGPCQPQRSRRSQRKPWPEGERGVCGSSCVSCALCGRRTNLGTSTAHKARFAARMAGYTYLETFGWVCGCRDQYPGMSDIQKAAGSHHKKTGPTRVQVSLVLE